MTLEDYNAIQAENGMPELTPDEFNQMMQANQRAQWYSKAIAEYDRVGDFTKPEPRPDGTYGPPRLTAANAAAHQANAVQAGTSSGTGVSGTVQPAGAVYNGQDVGGQTVNFNPPVEGGSLDFNNLVTGDGTGGTVVEPPPATGTEVSGEVSGAATVTPGQTGTTNGPTSWFNPQTRQYEPISTQPAAPRPTTPTTTVNNSPANPTGTQPSGLVLGPAAGTAGGTIQLPSGRVGGVTPPSGVTPPGTGGTATGGTTQPTGPATAAPATAAPPTVTPPSFNSATWQAPSATVMPTTGGTTSGAPALDWNQLTSAAGAGQSVAPNLQLPANRTGDGGNYDVTNMGAQTGGYASAGSTRQTGTGGQASGSTTTGATTGATTQTGETTGTTFGKTDTTSTGTETGTIGTTGVTDTSGTTSRTGTSSTGVVAPFDVQRLVSGVGGLADQDRARQAWLTDVMQTGGTGFNSQVDQAVRSALTGPATSGAGESARARMGGYAAAQVARNNMGERLAAAGQLAGPTAAGTAAQQFSPLYGQTRSDTGTEATTGTATQTGTQTRNLQTGQTTGQTTSGVSNQTSNQAGTSATNTAQNTAAQSLNFQDLVGQEIGGGTAWGNSASRGYGQALEGATQKSGGCVVCTAYVDLGQMKPGALRRAVKWKVERKARYALFADGYMLYGPVLARAVMKNGLFAKAFRPVARAILYHEVRLTAPRRLAWKLVPAVLHSIFDLGSRPIGLLARLLKVDAGVRCQQTVQLLERNNLKFTW